MRAISLLVFFGYSIEQISVRKDKAETAKRYCVQNRVTAELCSSEGVQPLCRDEVCIVCVVGEVGCLLFKGSGVDKDLEFEDFDP
jgi:hypothetical protein